MKKDITPLYKIADLLIKILTDISRKDGISFSNIAKHPWLTDAKGTIHEMFYVKDEQQTKG